MDARIAPKCHPRIVAMPSVSGRVDVFVVETKNFTDNTWIWAEGRASPHSDQLRLVERYRRPDKNTLEIEATVYDPKVLTGPWTVPKQTLVLAPFDQVMPLNCAEL
jgi:hypothetical protein